MKPNILHCIAPSSLGNQFLPLDYYLAPLLNVFSRNLETFTYLVEAGCDVNSKCHGTSPLHLSIATAILPNGGYELGLTCALKLISSSCDLNAKV